MPQDAVERETVRETVRTFILEEFLPGEDPDLLTDTTSLIRGGILDSISSTRLISHLEDTFGVQFSQKEVRVENLDNIESIVGLVGAKLNTHP